MKVSTAPPIETLAGLIHPMSEDHLVGLLRSGTFHFERGADRTRFEDLLSWGDLSHLLETGTVPASGISVLKNRQPLFQGMYLKDGKISVPVLTSLLDKGASMVVYGLDVYHAGIARLCRSVERRVGEQVIAAVILTTGSGGAFEIHFDYEDLLMVQVYGEKRWKIYDHPVPSPHSHMPKVVPDGLSVVFDEVLKPGDWMFLPAGHWHHCENSADRSLHVSVLIRPATGLGLIRDWTTQLRADELLRRPLTRDSESGTILHEAALKARLKEWVDRISVADYLQRETVARGSCFRLNLSGVSEISDCQTVSDCFLRRPVLPVLNEQSAATIEVEGKKYGLNFVEQHLLHLLADQGARTFGDIANHLSSRFSREVLVDGIRQLSLKNLVSVIDG